MILIPGSFSFAKLVMMSSVPAKSVGMPDVRSKIHPFVDSPIQSRKQTVLGVRSSTSNAIKIFTSMELQLKSSQRM